MELGDVFNELAEMLTTADIAADCNKRITRKDLENIQATKVIPQITSERYIKDLTISEFTDLVRNIVRSELASIPYHNPIYGPQRPQYPWENEVIC